jgi:serine protease inhibitor
MSTVGQRVEHAHLAFTLAVQRALSGSAVESSCFSPFSVASALGLAATGARGATRDELGTLLLGSPDGDLAEHAAMLVEAATLHDNGNGQPPVLGVADTLWADESLTVRPEFKEELSRWPNGAVRPAPFAEDQEAARRLINADVAETTRGLIPELLAKGVLTSRTVATLVNALYLKVAWVNRFPDRGTESLPFHAPTGTSDVPTMRLRKRLGYAAADGWQAVVLPAAGDVDAVVLMPDGRLTDAEPDLDAEALAALLSAPVPTLVDLFLPKFGVRAQSDLTSALDSLGAHTMFTGGADFGGISEQPMAVDAVVHEAVLTIDEQGLEGAAATAMVMRAMAMRVDHTEPVVVRVDRPFLFLVRHRPSGAVYFLSRVVNP